MDRRLNKFDRIKELQKWGLNTPHYVFFECGDISFRSWNPGTEFVSLRYFIPKGSEDRTFGKQPHSPNVLWEDALELMEQYHSYFHILVSPGGMNYKDTIHCGTLQMELHSIDGFGIAIFEYATGPYTVRDINKVGRTVICNLHGNVFDQKYNPVLTRVKKEALKFPEWNQCIFEWSAYPYPIGWKKDNIIFWEYRGR